MPADSDTKSAAVPGAATSLQIETADGRAPSSSAPASVPRPLLGEIAARLAQAVRGLRRDSTMRESLEEVIEESERETQDLSSQERLMLANLLTFGELSVSDVMVPRADIVAVEEQTPFAEAVALFREAQHSRLPIYRETLDDPLGMVHIKDIVALVEIGADGQLHWPPTPLSKLKREVLFVPAAMPALDLLMKMQATRIHMALVVDEYGGTDGLVSIEDIVEQIVGEIDDEHDSDEPPAIVRQADNSFIADARASLDDVRSVIGEEFVTGEAGEEVATLGGFLVSHVGRLPVRGEVISGPGNFEIEVLDADPRRVKRLRIGTRKERTPLRSLRENRRREASPDAAQPGEQTNPPGDGAASS
jgi:CBS domain containing-hemolysin-like protein